MSGKLKYKLFISFLLASMLAGSFAYSQQVTGPLPVDSIAPVPPLAERKKNWGPNDTVIVAVIWYQNQLMPYQELDNVIVSNLPPEKLAKYMAEWNRLRNAVYVTYPYARIAGMTINDINKNLEPVKGKKERKAYIKSREKELKKQFSDPLSDLSVYQGKILMKLINRQTGNNCYEIVKEYRGGVTARFYQTVAFFFGSSMKQEWDVTDKIDRQIENIINEIDGSWYNNPNRR